MVDRTPEEAKIEDGVEAILAHLRTLHSNAERTAAAEEMELAMQHPSALALPQWLRGIDSKAIMQARIRAQNIMRENPNTPNSVSSN